MRNGRAFPLSDLGSVISDERFYGVSMHLPGWWKNLLHGISLKAMSGIYSVADVSWHVVSSPLAIIGDTIRTISDDEFNDRLANGLGVGMIEWAHLSMASPAAEIIVATVSGLQGGDKVWLFSNCREAPCLFHGFAIQAKLSYRVRSNRSALRPIPFPEGVPSRIPRWTAPTIMTMSAATVAAMRSRAVARAAI
jgi:hypothetical protein